MSTTRDHVGADAAGRFVVNVCAGVAGLILLAGCGASDEETSDGTGQSATTSTSYISPLSEFLDPGSNSGDDGMTAAADREKKIQELVATCMADQGFEYEPFVYPMDTTKSPMDDLDYSSRAFAEKYGYGISTMDHASISTAESTVVDPNQAIVEAMSESELQAYYAALYGSGMMAEAFPSEESASEVPAAPSSAPQTPDAAAAVSSSSSGTSAPEAPVSIPEQSMVEPSMVTMADQGCTGQAQAEVYGDPDAQQTQFQGLFDAMNQMYTDIEKDPRTKSAIDAWIGCMADAGHAGYTEIYGATNEANEKWGEINGWDSEASGAVASSSASTAVPAGPPADEVAAFTAYEIALATADFDCKQSSDYAKVADEVRIAAEEKFLTDHRAELEQYRDAMNGGG